MLILYICMVVQLASLFPNAPAPRLALPTGLPPGFSYWHDFLTLAGRVNVQGIDCIGGTMMKIADYLTEIGMSGADCAGTMMDEYTELLERVGIDQKKAAKNVIGLFMPLIHKYRHGMKIK